jgi:hypothetical protein
LLPALTIWRSSLVNLLAGVRSMFGIWSILLTDLVNNIKVFYLAIALWLLLLLLLVVRTDSIIDNESWFVDIQMVLWRTLIDVLLLHLTCSITCRFLLEHLFLCATNLLLLYLLLWSLFSWSRPLFHILVSFPDLIIKSLLRGAQFLILI